MQGTGKKMGYFFPTLLAHVLALVEVRLSCKILVKVTEGVTSPQHSALFLLSLQCCHSEGVCLSSQGATGSLDQCCAPKAHQHPREGLHLELYLQSVCSDGI